MKTIDSEVGEIERLRVRLAKMSEASRRVTESWDLDTVLQEVVDGARSLTDARYGAVGVFDDSGRVREFITSGITTEERRLLGDLPKGLGILGYLNEIQEPLRLTDLARHARSVGFPENHPPMKTFLGAPIRHLGEPVGNIYLTEKEGGEFSEEDEETLVMFTSQAAIAIGNALRYQEERLIRDEMETERRRLAALVESSPVGVMVVDAATRTFASVNQEAERASWACRPRPAPRSCGITRWLSTGARTGRGTKTTTVRWRGRWTAARSCGPKRYCSTSRTAGR